MVSWVPAFGLSSNQWAMVNVVTIAASLGGSVGSGWSAWSTCRRPRCMLHSSDEPGELSQWQCTISIVVAVTVAILLLCITEEKQLADCQQAEIEQLQRKVSELQGELKSEMKHSRAADSDAHVSMLCQLRSLWVRKQVKGRFVLRVPV